MKRQCDCGSYAINPELHGRKSGVRSHLCDVCYWREEARILREALENQRRWWENVPSGVDYDCDPDDPCPDDDTAWRAGCAIRDIDDALKRAGGGE